MPFPCSGMGSPATFGVTVQVNAYQWYAKSPTTTTSGVSYLRPSMVKSSKNALSHPRSSSPVLGGSPGGKKHGSELAGRRDHPPPDHTWVTQRVVFLPLAAKQPQIGYVVAPFHLSLDSGFK